MNFRDWGLIIWGPGPFTRKRMFQARPHMSLVRKSPDSPGRSSRFDKRKSSDIGSELRTSEEGLGAMRAPTIDSAPVFAALHRIVH